MQGTIAHALEKTKFHHHKHFPRDCWKEYMVVDLQMSVGRANVLRQVRLKERRKRRSEGSARRLYFSVVIYLRVLIVLVENNDEETEQLRASVDFPVDLCDTIYNPDDANFTNWSHQVVDFILDSIKNITSHGKITDSVEGIIGSLSLFLVRKMCTTLQGDGVGQVHIDTQFHVQY
ncbi:protein multipolar spindle 1 isoform X2 [Tanacetum coccineum]